MRNSSESLPITWTEEESLRSGGARRCLRHGLEIVVPKHGDVSHLEGAAQRETRLTCSSFGSHGATGGSSGPTDAVCVHPTPKDSTPYSCGGRKDTVDVYCACARATRTHLLSSALPRVLSLRAFGDDGICVFSLSATLIAFQYLNVKLA